MIKKLCSILQNNETKEFITDSRILFKNYKAFPKRIFLLANGGTFANIEHLLVDWVKTLQLHIEVPSSGGTLTAYGNDFGFENIFSEWIKHRSIDKNCLLIALSSSGSSPNILKACEYAKTQECKIITGWGFHKNNPLSQYGDIQYYVDSKNYNVIETAHLASLLEIFDYNND